MILLQQNILRPAWYPLTRQVRLLRGRFSSFVAPRERQLDPVWIISGMAGVGWTLPLLFETCKFIILCLKLVSISDYLIFSLLILTPFRIKEVGDRTREIKRENYAFSDHITVVVIPFPSPHKPKSTTWKIVCRLIASFFRALAMTPVFLKHLLPHGCSESRPCYAPKWGEQELILGERIKYE